MDADRLPFSREALPVEGLLESFALDRDYVPRGMERITDANELPVVLAHLARRHQRTLSTWCAWADERRTLFVTARMLPASAKNCGPPVLCIRFYDEDGRLMSTGAWTQRRGGSWALCAVGPTMCPTRTARNVPSDAGRREPHNAECDASHR
jgi:hypothetical protein